MTLTKAHIAETIHDRLHFTNDRSAQLVDSLLEILKKTLENGEALRSLDFNDTKHRNQLIILIERAVYNGLQGN